MPDESPLESTPPNPAAPAPRLHLLGATGDELRAWTAGLDLEPYRAAQIAEWVFERGASSFDEMTNLSKAARAACAAKGEIYRGEIASQSVAADATTKLLIRWPDAASVEAVWIPEEDRNTACISSQVGCPVGCRFCASGLSGVERNLTAGEIVEQAMWIRRRIAAQDSAPPGPAVTSGLGVHGPVASGVRAHAARQPTDSAPSQPHSTEGRLSNIVLMGMGEPLANYDAVIKAIRLINSPHGLGIGARKITLSTVGLPAQIRRLADEGLQINLALSLHAPDDALRHELIPWGKGVRIADLIAAGRHYFDKTGREITLEYVLLDGVNNLARHADALAGVARQLRCNVNLLRYNPVEGTPYRRPAAESAFDFQRLLRAKNVNAHIRTSRGTDVNAACGQLRRSSLPILQDREA